MATSGISLRVISNRIPALAASLRPKASQIVRKTALDIKSSASMNTVRVDTSAMKNGYQTQPRGPLTEVVFNTQDYHIHHELGAPARNISASPMLVPAAEAARAPFEAAFKQLVSGL